MCNFKKDVESLIWLENQDRQLVLDRICKQYGIKERQVYNRIRTIYGKPIKQLRFDYYEPSKEDFEQKLLISQSAKELRHMYSYLPDSQWKGIYDRIMNVSNFSKSKKLAELNRISRQEYNPSIFDNMGLIAGGVIGDSSIDKTRKAIRIEHGVKQLEWLKQKITMYNRAFPFTKDDSNLGYRENTDSYRWYSGTFSSSKYGNMLATFEKIDYIQYFNPVAYFILFMDDGHMLKTQTGMNIAIENSKIGELLQLDLLSYGIQSKLGQNNTCLHIRGLDSHIAFYELFLHPFLYLVPSCMEYKTHLKI